MSGASKIPPHIARELKRHVRPRPTSAAGSSAGKNAGKAEDSSNSKVYTLIGCAAFVGVTASFPLMGLAWIRPLSDRDEVR
jgi:hypothetical protein